MSLKFKSNEEGKCPICGNEDLDYGEMEIEGILGNSCAFPWHCSKCNTDGKEWYYTEYDQTVSRSGNSVEEPEICPDCGAEIEYGIAEPEGSQLGYMYNCTECDGSGYEWYDLSFDSHTIDGHEGEDIEMINEGLDYKDVNMTVTTAEDSIDNRNYYGANMTKRDKVRSLNQAKRNLKRMGNDNRVSDGQAVDQISFDSLPNADLQNYIHNKNQAKKAQEIGDNFWADEHNKTAKTFADKLKNKTMKKEDIETDEDVDIDNENDEEEIDYDTTISLLDIALKEIPIIGVEDWGKDDELNFVADTKVLFENLSEYEEEIPKYFYDNAGYDDWSNGIDDYLETMLGIDPESGKSDNTYNWNAPLTHDVEFTMYETEDACYFKGSIHRSGDVRGNYTTEFLLKFDNGDACFEEIYDSCSENCYRNIEVDGNHYTVSPHFFNENVDIWCEETQENYDDVYCTCIEELKEIIAENKLDNAE